MKQTLSGNELLIAKKVTNKCLFCSEAVIWKSIL